MRFCATTRMPVYALLTGLTITWGNSLPMAKLYNLDHNLGCRVQPIMHPLQHFNQVHKTPHTNYHNFKALLHHFINDQETQNHFTQK